MTRTAKHRWLGFGLVLVLATLVASGVRAETCPIAGQSPTLVVQLFFGQNIAGKKDISPMAWEAFLRKDVTPRFPDGFTVFDSIGQWRDRTTSRVGQEKSKVIEIATPDTPEVRSNILAVAARYRTLFHQQSVGIVTMPGCAAF